MATGKIMLIAALIIVTWVALISLMAYFLIRYNDSTFDEPIKEDREIQNIFNK